jgi:hypothetical protein
MEDEKVIFEENWDIFVLTGMPWPDIKHLSESDRKNLANKAKEAKQRALNQYNEENNK